MNRKQNKNLKNYKSPMKETGIWIARQKKLYEKI